MAALKAKFGLFSVEELEQRRQDAMSLACRNFTVSMDIDTHSKYVRFYCDVLLENGRKLNFNRYQRYTALILMQRVYTTRTIWDIPPPLAMISCLFLTAKFTGPHTISGFVTAMGYGDDFRRQFDPETQIAKVEIAILTALNFNLRVHLPFHQINVLAGDAELESSAAAYQILRTDVLMLFPPGEVAVAAVAHAIGVDAAIAALVQATGKESPGIRERIDAILALKAETMTADEVKEIESHIGAELAVFHVVGRERAAEEGRQSGPTAMLPP